MGKPRKLKHVPTFKGSKSDMPMTQAMLTITPYFSPLAGSCYMKGNNYYPLSIERTYAENYKSCTYQQQEMYCKR